VVPDLVCRTPAEVLDIFLDRRDQEIEVDRLELIGTERGAVFAFHRPENWQFAGIEIRGAMYHSVAIEDGRITRIEDHADRGQAMRAAGVDL
jgi:hypothetical protein